MAEISKTDDIAVRLENVTVNLGDVSILESVSAAIPRGGCTAIIGPNGAGKTTLLLALLKSIEFHGNIHILPGRHGAARVGYVPQKLSFDRDMPLTVAEFLVMGQQRLPLWFGVQRARRQRVAEQLEAVRAGYLAERRLGALSGGELQRVLLALALQQDPDILVLDEFVEGVDVKGEQILCELLESLRRERHFTQIIVSHDLSLVTAHATHVICLNRRVLAEGPPQTVLTTEILLATFGLHMGLPNLKSLPAGDACAASCDCKEAHHA
jgi:zinc transport system ATP-binding protein